MKKIESLNTLRGIAALLVALDHFALVLLQPPQDSFTFYIATFAGAFGVGVFFLISGFVIAFSLANLPTQTFLFRRILRIYPVFIMCCFIKWTIMVSAGTAEFNYDFLKVFLLNISMFGGTQLFLDKNIEPIVWTLAVEVKFYLLCAIIYYFAKDNNKRLFHLFIVSSILIAVASYFLRDFDAPWKFDVGLALSSIPFMIIGVLLNLYYAKKIDSEDLIFGLVCTISSFFLAPMRWFVSIEKGIPTWGLASLIFMLTLLYGKDVTVLNGKIGKWLGNLSYPMYAVHPALAFFVSVTLPKLNYFQKTVTFLTLTLIGASLIHVLIEKPSIKISKLYGKKNF